MMLVVGSGLALTGGQALAAERRFARDGRTTRAAVIRKSIQPATSDTSTRYEVIYRATLPDGGPVERTEEVDVGVWEGLEAGSALTVQYLPQQPDSVRLAREPEIAGNAIALGIGAVSAPAGFALLALGLRDEWRRAWLLRRGTPADATVTAVEQTNVTVNRRGQWRIRFTYRDHLGQERRGASGYLAEAVALEWSRGDVGRVHFDPGRPERVLWIGGREART
jgi:hypothetical protein